jgi:hypothetical protein
MFKLEITVFETLVCYMGIIPMLSTPIACGYVGSFSRGNLIRMSLSFPMKLKAE